MSEPVVAQRHRVLFVDDDSHLLHALGRQVHGFVRAELCTSPQAAAKMLEQPGAAEFAVVVSDMRMPDMDGATLLKHAAQVCPDATRILLTGYSDLDSAIAAVNNGNIFRFLTKPCPTPQLRAAISAAIEQRDLVRERRELLDQTLRGAVQALVDTLAIAVPEAFDRACRLRRLVVRVAERLRLPDRWQLEVAAQLGEIGVVTLPPQALDALNRGTTPDRAVSAMLDALPGLADAVLRRIPGMEPVRQIVWAQQPVDHVVASRMVCARQGARILQAVREYDALCARGGTPAGALSQLRERSYHDRDVLDALGSGKSTVDSGSGRPVDIDDLRPGMVLATDLRGASGSVLCGRGQPLTDEMLARIRNHAALVPLPERPVVTADS